MDKSATKLTTVVTVYSKILVPETSMVARNAGGIAVNTTKKVNVLMMIIVENPIETYEKVDDRMQIRFNSLPSVVCCGGRQNWHTDHSREGFVINFRKVCVYGFLVS